MSDALRDALAADAAARDAVPGHPDPETLGAYYEGRLDDAAEKRVRGHLAGCAACSEWLLDLAAFEADAAGPEEEGADGPPRDELADARAWRRLEARLDEASETDGTEAPAEPARADARHRPWLPALAAALAAAAIGLGAWGVAERQRAGELAERVAALESPLANVPVLYLDAATRTGSEPPTVAAADGSRLLLLVIGTGELPGDGAARRYRATVATATGAPVLAAGELEASSYGTLRLAVPTRALPPGDYRLTLHLEDAAADRPPLVRHRFRVGRAP